MYSRPNFVFNFLERLSASMGDADPRLPEADKHLVVFISLAALYRNEKQRGMAVKVFRKADEVGWEVVDPGDR